MMECKQPKGTDLRLAWLELREILMISYVLLGVGNW